jgi:hypothetical protein
MRVIDPGRRGSLEYRLPAGNQAGATRGSPLLLLLFLFFLIPLSVYCLVLAGINRRAHPVMISGGWDCIGLLFAASGFFLCVLPGAVTLWYSERVRQLPFAQPRPHSAAEALGSLWLEWWGVLLLYYIALAVGATALVLHRRAATVIYNINPEDWERVFAQVLAKLGLEQTRSGKQITVAALTSLADDSPGSTSETAVTAYPSLLQRTVLLRVDTFPALCNITLHWEHVGAELREEIQTELAKATQSVETVDNPAGSWFLGIGGSIITMVFLTVLVLIILSIPRRW